MAIFTEDDLKRYSFAAVIENGRKSFMRGRVSNLHFIGNDIIAIVKGDRQYRVAINRADADLSFGCDCGFAYGGACEHAVAVMLAANDNQAIQVGINWDDLLTDTATPEPSPAVALPVTASAVVPTVVQPVQPHILPVSFETPDKINDLFDTPLQQTENDREADSDIDESSIALTEIPASKPVVRIYLSETELMLLVELRFAYNNGKTEFLQSDNRQYKIIAGDSGTFCKVHRSRVREMSIVAKMIEFELMQYQTGFFTPSDDPRIWTLHELPRLAAEGYEIYGQEKLKNTNARKCTPKLSVAIKTNNALFECNVEVSFDGISATLASLIHAIRHGSKFVLLTDGSSGLLPQEWIEKFAGLFAAFETDDNAKMLSIRESHVALAGMLYDMADIRSSDNEFLSKKDLFATFKGVEKHNPPQTFHASMRPYQLAGYEWFYFLKKFKFGGCLADDMGLGKTVQTLALLQKEKECSEHHPSLVIVPTSLLFNWQREAEKFAPALQVLCYHGNGRAKYKDIMTMADVVLTSYGTVLRDIGMLSKINFHYIILDEAQVIKNPSAHISQALRQLRSTYRLALSGTPIENNLSELWSMFSFINPGMLGSFRNFATNFIKPIEKEMNDQAADVLRRLLFPYILRRTKQQVAKELPPKNEIVMYAEMLPKQKMIYDITREMYRGKIEDSFEKEGSDRTRFQILEGMLRLRQICCHPQMMDPSFTGDSGKFRLIEESIIDVTSEGHRILVFSQFVKALEIMKQRIAEKGIHSEILTGSTPDRQKVVDRFQKENGAPVFFISLKAGGTGLNLTAADYVIHMDPWWNPSAENQASDRAYRIGQTRTVFVYKMITKDSIEERVLEMQQRKQHLMHSIIHTEKSFFKQLTKDDVLGMFT
mgnify:FL=1